MSNLVSALLALAAFAAFFVIIIAWVPHVDLTVMILIGLGLAIYDVWQQIRRPGPSEGQRPD